MHPVRDQLTGKVPHAGEREQSGYRQLANAPATAATVSLWTSQPINRTLDIGPTSRVLVLENRDATSYETAPARSPSPPRITGPSILPAPQKVFSESQVLRGERERNLAVADFSGGHTHPL